MVSISLKVQLGMSDRLKSIKVKRTNQQWKAFPSFKHCVEFSRQYNYENYWEYYIAQQWCWDDFGPSINLDILEELKRTNREMNQIWTFQPKTNMYPCRIYLKGDKELELFLLKWG